jgi:uncharacterized protein (TIGR03083 family)
VPTLAPSPAWHTLDYPRVLDLIKAEVDRIGALIAETDDGTARVPSCPDWTLADLVRHAGQVHRSTAAVLTRLPQKRIELTEEELHAPDGWGAQTTQWFAEGGALLLAALRAVNPEAPCYAWGADQHARFWFRRMLHESTMHRIDVEYTVLGQPGGLDAAVASDSIDEFLTNVPSMARFRPAVRELHGDGETIHLHATDLAGGELPGEWLITLEPHGFRWSHSHVKGAAAVRGPVRDLALWVSGRLEHDDPALERLGEEPLLTYWRAKTAF